MGNNILRIYMHPSLVYFLLCLLSPTPSLCVCVFPHIHTQQLQTCRFEFLHSSLHFVSFLHQLLMVPSDPHHVVGVCAGVCMSE